MKKLFYTLLAISTFFFGFTITYATTLNRTSNGNGSVKLSLLNEDGYVGAIDATIKITGDVTFDKLEWDSKIPSSYIKKTVYNKSNNTVRIYVATGSLSHNLADANHNIPIGNIKVKATKETNYDINISSLVITNMDFKFTAKSNVENNSKEGFTYKLNSTTPEPDDSKPDDSKQDSNNDNNDKEDNNTSNNNKPNNNNSNNNTTSSGTTSNKANNGTTNNKNKTLLGVNIGVPNNVTIASNDNDDIEDSDEMDTTEETTTDETLDTSNEDTSNKVDNKDIDDEEETKEAKDDKKEDKFSVGTIVVGALIILIIASAITFIYQKVRK